MQYRYSGSEVSVEPNGNVYPCCMKTQLAIGNLLEERLETILDRLAGNPVYEAISMGHPERMCVSYGWSVDKFLEKSKIALSGGRVYQNLCIGCDAFHREVLMGQRTQLVSISAQAPTCTTEDTSPTPHLKGTRGQGLGAEVWQATQYAFGQRKAQIGESDRVVNARIAGREAGA